MSYRNHYMCSGKATNTKKKSLQFCSGATTSHVYNNKLHDMSSIPLKTPPLSYRKATGKLIRYFENDRQTDVKEKYI